LKVFADTLGYEQKKFMNLNKLWFHLALYLKMLVLLNATDVPNFMLESKSAQFAKS